MRRSPQAAPGIDKMGGQPKGHGLKVEVSLRNWHWERGAQFQFSPQAAESLGAPLAWRCSISRRIYRGLFIILKYTSIRYISGADCVVIVSCAAIYDFSQLKPGLKK